MSNIKVASRYASSLLDLSVEKNALEAVIGDMKMLLSIAEQNRDLGLTLKSPIVTYDKKFNILKALFGKTANEITMSFFDLVTRKNRSNVLIPTAQEFLRQYNEYKGIQVAEVTVTLPLTEKLKKEKLRLEYIINRPVICSRQHYLRLSLPDTYQNLLDIDLKEDYTMGYEKSAGFRASTCTPFYFYDLDFEILTPLKIFPFALFAIFARCCNSIKTSVFLV